MGQPPLIEEPVFTYNCHIQYLMFVIGSGKVSELIEVRWEEKILPELLSFELYTDVVAEVCQRCA